MAELGLDEIVGDFGVGESTYVRLDDGNDALARAVADALPDVRTNRPVRTISTTDHGHTLGAGTIDGAIESGELAATRVRNFLSRTAGRS